MSLRCQWGNSTFCVNYHKGSNNFSYDQLLQWIKDNIQGTPAPEILCSRLYHHLLEEVKLRATGLRVTVTEAHPSGETRAELSNWKG